MTQGWVLVNQLVASLVEVLGTFFILVRCDLLYIIMDFVVYATFISSMHMNYEGAVWCQL